MSKSKNSDVTDPVVEIDPKDAEIEHLRADNKDLRLTVDDLMTQLEAPAEPTQKAKPVDWCDHCKAPAQPTADGKHHCQCRQERR